MNEQQQRIDWQPILDELAEEVRAARFDAWIRPVCAAVEGRTLTLSVPSRFFLDNLRDHHENAIRNKVQQHYGDDVQIEFGVNPELVVENPQVENPGNEKSGQVDGFIDHRFTFANFVVGPSNEFCHAACRAVADLPGSTYNPLYLYGGVGLGKTHLINAVANELLSKHHFKIAYRTSERFTNELISAIRNGTTQKFSDR